MKIKKKVHEQVCCLEAVGDHTVLNIVGLKVQDVEGESIGHD